MYVWRCITPRHSNPLTCAEHSLVCSQRIMQYTKLRFDDSTTDVFTSTRHLPVTVIEEPGCPGDSCVCRSIWTHGRDDFIPTCALGFLCRRPLFTRTSWTYLLVHHIIASACHRGHRPKVFWWATMAVDESCDRHLIFSNPPCLSIHSSWNKGVLLLIG